MQGTPTSSSAAPPPFPGLGALRQWGLEAVHCVGRRSMRRSALRRFVREVAAQDLAEYGISLAVIGAGAAAAALTIRGSVAAMWVEHARLLQKLASLAGN